MTILCAFFLFALAGLVLDRSPQTSAAANAGRRVSPWPSIALAALSVLSLAAYEVAVDRAAMAQLPFPAWLAGAPLVPIVETARTGGAPPWIALVAEAFAVVQSGLLVAVAVALRGAADSRALRCVFASCVVAEIAVALCARGSTSADLYAYAFDAARGVAAYHPLPIDPRGPFALVGHLWSFRMLPAAYGPVWLAAAHLVAGRASDLGSAILALRLLSACSFAAVLGALVALRVPTVFLGLVALDPAIPYQFVADGHNDLFGIALLLWARVAAREKPALAVVLALLAGASKISFVALAPLAFVDAGDLRRRLTLCGAAGAGAVAVSLAAGGLAYPRAIAAISAIFPASGEPGGAIVPRLTTICAIVLVALALIVRRTGWPGTWAFVSLGSIPFPWYLAWGLPYAVLDPERALPYLVTFPFAAFVMTTTFPASWAWPPVAIGLPVVAALLAYGRFRGRRGAFARPFSLAARRASVL